MCIFELFNMYNKWHERHGSSLCIWTNKQTNKCERGGGVACTDLTAITCATPPPPFIKSLSHLKMDPHLLDTQIRVLSRLQLKIFNQFFTFSLAIPQLEVRSAVMSNAFRLIICVLLLIFFCVLSIILLNNLWGQYLTTIFWTNTVCDYVSPAPYGLPCLQKHI